MERGALSSVVADINAYKAWYGVSGVFLDEMSNVVGHESYYSALTSYSHSLDLATVVGNPGAAFQPPTSGRSTS